MRLVRRTHAAARDTEAMQGAGLDHPPPRHPQPRERRMTKPLRPMTTAPRDGTEVLVQVKLRAGVPGKWLVGHYMEGGHCIEDHPPVAEGWYFWNGRMFDRAAEPIGWLPLPKVIDELDRPWWRWGPGGQVAIRDDGMRLERVCRFTIFGDKIPGWAASGPGLPGHAWVKYAPYVGARIEADEALAIFDEAHPRRDEEP